MLTIVLHRLLCHVVLVFEDVRAVVAWLNRCLDWGTGADGDGTALSYASAQWALSWSPRRG